MVIKYFTTPTFNREAFASLLRNTMSVPAVAVNDGILLDKDAFLNWEPARMPTWAFINRDDIRSPFHTRPATEAEVKLLDYPTRYRLKFMYRDWTIADMAATVERLMEEGKIFHDAEKVLIEDIFTGEVKYLKER